MIGKLKQAWRGLLAGSGQLESSTHRLKKAEFRLIHGSNLIGVLTYQDGRWTFRYSDEFKSRSDLRPIVQFPDKERIYDSEDLWPFFAMRIPSLKQPAIEKIVKFEQIDASDSVELLKRFGRRTITNPYELAGID